MRMPYRRPTRQDDMQTYRQDGLPTWLVDRCPGDFTVVGPISDSHAYILTHKGVIKTYKLSYESAEIMHALFNKNTTQNTWTISASALRSFAEYFGAKTEQLDISSENGRTTLTSYTEKIMNGKGLFLENLTKL